MLFFDVILGKCFDQSRNDWFWKICFGMKFHQNSENLTFSMTIWPKINHYEVQNDRFDKKRPICGQKWLLLIKNDRFDKKDQFEEKMTIFNDQHIFWSYLELNNRSCFDQLRFRSVRPWNTVQEKRIFAQSLDRFEKIWCQVHFISQFRLFRLKKLSIFSQ